MINEKGNFLFGNYENVVDLRKLRRYGKIKQTGGRGHAGGMEDR